MESLLHAAQSDPSVICDGLSGFIVAVFSLCLFVGRNDDKIRLMSNIVVPQPSKISGSTLLIILGHCWSNSLFLKGLV